jgi:hypothetical protein
MNQYRITIRRTHIIEADDTPYKSLSTNTLSTSFGALDLNPGGELNTPFVGRKTNQTYNYSMEESYEGA